MSKILTQTLIVMSPMATTTNPLMTLSSDKNEGDQTTPRTW